MFKIYFEPEPPVANEGPCLMPRTEIAKGGSCFRLKKNMYTHIYIYDEPVSPVAKGGSVFKLYVEPESPEGACFMC